MTNNDKEITSSSPPYCSSNARLLSSLVTLSSSNLYLRASQILSKNVLIGRDRTKKGNSKQQKEGEAPLSLSMLHTVAMFKHNDY